VRISDFFQYQPNEILKIRGGEVKKLKVFGFQGLEQGKWAKGSGFEAGNWFEYHPEGKVAYLIIWVEVSVTSYVHLSYS
jgi:hypothetical protein